MLGAKVCAKIKVVSNKIVGEGGQKTRVNVDGIYVM